jgi:hypothetical protein
MGECEVIAARAKKLWRPFPGQRLVPENKGFHRQAFIEGLSTAVSDAQLKAIN